MTRNPALSITPSKRFEVGMIATVRAANGKTISRHFSGGGKDAARDVAAWCDRIGARVVSISTPQTIYRDLQGSRVGMSDRQANNRRGSYSPHVDNTLETPEPKMLGRIGRRDLLHD